MIINIWLVECLLAPMGVVLIGSYTVICLSNQHRECRRLEQTGCNSVVYMILMTLCVGVGMIWTCDIMTMHSISLLSGGLGVTDIRLDWSVLLLMPVCYICVAGAGLGLASSDKIYVKDKREVYADVIAICSKLAMEKIQNRWVIWRMAVFRDTIRIVAAGIFTGGGICLIKFIVLSFFTDYLVVHWDYALLATSSVLASVSFILCFWMLFRVFPLYPQKEYLRLASCVCTMIFLCSTMYTSSAAASLSFAIQGSGEGISSGVASVCAVSVSIFIFWIAIIVVTTNMRICQRKLSSCLDKARLHIEYLTRGDDFILRQSIDMTNSLPFVQRQHAGNFSPSYSSDTSRMTTSTNTKSHSPVRVFPELPECDIPDECDEDMDSSSEPV